jgi:hypothetical protein
MEGANPGIASMVATPSGLEGVAHVTLRMAAALDITAKLPLSRIATRRNIEGTAHVTVSTAAMLKSRTNLLL